MSYSGQTVVHYFDNSAYVGFRTQYSCGYTHAGESGSGYWPNVAYFCSECGEIWGREVMEHQFNYSPLPSGKWLLVHRPCVTHGDGTFMFELENASVELLTRELLALLNGVKDE